MVVACDGCTDAHRRAAPARPEPTACSSSSGAARSTALNAAAASVRRGRCSRSPTPTRRWEPGALRRLVAPFADDGVGYVCGQVTLHRAGRRANEEGLYWRYEMAVRRMESGLAGITAGNGAINAVRREAYVALDPARGQDISFPFELAKRGWRAVYEPDAARERADGADDRGRVPAQAPDDGRRLEHDPATRRLLSPRGYSPLYALEIYSHRLLRYATPILHLVALGDEHRPGRRGERLRGDADRPGRLARRGAASAGCSRCAPLARSPATTRR